MYYSSQNKNQIYKIHQLFFYQFCSNNFPHKKISEIFPWIICQLVIMSVLSLSVVLQVYYRVITVNFYYKKNRVPLNITKSH